MNWLMQKGAILYRLEEHTWRVWRWQLCIESVCQTLYSSQNLWHYCKRTYAYNVMPSSIPDMCNFIKAEHRLTNVPSNQGPYSFIISVSEWPLQYKYLQSYIQVTPARFLYFWNIDFMFFFILSIMVSSVLIWTHEIPTFPSSSPAHLTF